MFFFSSRSSRATATCFCLRRETQSTGPTAAARRALAVESAEVAEAGLAVSETVILLHPLLVLVGVSIAMERERQQNDSLADG